MKTKREINEEERRAARLAAAERRRALLEDERRMSDDQRADVLQKAGEIRTTDGARLSPKNTILVYQQAAAAGFLPSVVGGFNTPGLVITPHKLGQWSDLNNAAFVTRLNEMIAAVNDGGDIGAAL